MAEKEIKIKLTIDGKESTASIHLTDAELKKLSTSLDSVNKNSKLTGDSMVSAFHNARNVIQGFKETFDVLRNTLAEPLKAFADIEQANISFEVMLGSAEKAKQMLEDLRSFGATTPLEFAGLQKNAQMLLSFGIAAKDILPTLQMLGDVSGGNAQKMESLTLAYSQMMSTGKLMGQDLLQMINAGFNPLQIISEKTGKSIGDLKKEMEKGTISSENITQAFKDATAEGGRFFGMLNKQSQSTGGALSNFNDTMDTLKQQSGAAFAQGITPLLNGVNSILTAASSASPQITGFAGAVGLLSASFVTLRVTGILPAITSMKLFGVSLLTVKGALISSGIGAAIVLLGTLTYKLSEAFNKYKEAKAGLGNALNYTPEAEGTKAGQQWAIKNAESERKRLTEEKQKLWSEIILKTDYKASDVLEAYKNEGGSGDETLDTYVSKLKGYNQQLTLLGRTITVNQEALNSPAKTTTTPIDKKKKLTPYEKLRLEIDKARENLEWSLAQSRANKETFDQILKNEKPKFTGKMGSIDEFSGMSEIEKDYANTHDNFGKMNDTNQTFTDMVGQTRALSMGAYSANIAFQTLGGTMSNAFSKAMSKIKGVNSLLEIFLVNIGEATGQLLIMQTVRGLFNLATGGLGGFMGGFTKLATGGIVTSPTFAMVGEAGPEAVIPLRNMPSFAPQMIHVTVGGTLKQSGMDMKVVLDRVDKYIASMK